MVVVVVVVVVGHWNYDYNKTCLYWGLVAKMENNWNMLEVNVNVSFKRYPLSRKYYALQWWYMQTGGNVYYPTNINDDLSSHYLYANLTNTHIYLAITKMQKRNLCNRLQAAEYV